MNHENTFTCPTCGTQIPPILEERIVNAVKSVVWEEKQKLEKEKIIFEETKAAQNTYLASERHAMKKNVKAKMKAEIEKEEKAYYEQLERELAEMKKQPAWFIKLQRLFGIDHW